MIRYAITYKHADGTRRFVHPNQGRFHFDSEEEANESADALRPGLKGRLGIEGVRVDPVDCYENGDAKSAVF